MYIVKIVELEVAYFSNWHIKISYLENHKWFMLIDFVCVMLHTMIGITFESI